MVDVLLSSRGSGRVQVEILSDLVERFRPILIALSIVFAIVSMLETVWVYQCTDNLALAERPSKILVGVYAVVFILAFLSIDVTKWRVSERLNWSGARSYGIFLRNPVLLEWIGSIDPPHRPGLLIVPVDT